MRLVTTACAAVLAITTAALAQVADPANLPANEAQETDHNALMHHSPREMVPMSPVEHIGHTMPDASAPMVEPK